VQQKTGPINGVDEPAGFNFFFQIATERGRRACCVKVGAESMHNASAVFRENWPAIETMARDKIQAGTDEGVITLEFR
jgi:hypothetical protein